MKRCSKCGKNSSLKNFYKRKAGPRSGQYYEKCKDCYKNRGREYYFQNREKQLELSKKRKGKYISERKKFFKEVKNKPCTDCGKKYSPWVMDFDHKDGELKLGSVSKLALRKFWSMTRIKEEIKKCDLVCANCHRERTYKRLNAKEAELAKLVKARV